MFTGIVEELGIVKNIERRSNLLRLGIVASFAGKVKIGDSISVNGACLTAVKIEGSMIFFDAVSSTIKTTTIGSLKLNDKVNLEQALKAGDKIGGHFVTGHVDAAGVIRKKTGANEQFIIEISIDAKFMDGIVAKGSIAVDGISLTVADIKRNTFVVSIIPHTLKLTTLGFKEPGDAVNIELDAMGKYSRLRSSCVEFGYGFGGQARQGPDKASIPAKDKITEEFLREHGF